VERQVEHTPIAPTIATATVSAPQPDVEVSRSTAPAARSAPLFEELVIPASSVIGLEIDSAISSETARVEDRVDARVTRDVLADGRVAIPAGARVIGAVTLVERGGKVKERARLGVRFHTLVLGDGRQVDMRTDTIYREGESVSAESSKKIGGAAIGGAVLGAIMGGGKGALLGGAAGAAGGTAAVMAGGRNPATLPGGTVVTARVTGPVSIEVEKR
jgi:type IV secretory pathway VirB10-like protein